jgi:NADH:ubiquinone oxidoreductase subunit K
VFAASAPLRCLLHLCHCAICATVLFAAHATLCCLLHLHHCAVCCICATMLFAASAPLCCLLHLRHFLVCCMCIAVLFAAGESSWVAAMATTSSVLHQAFEYFHWTVRAGMQAARAHTVIVC